MVDEKMYKEGLEYIDILLSSEDPVNIYLAGLYWNKWKGLDKKEIINKKLVEIGDPLSIYCAGEKWGEDIYTSRVAEALVRLSKEEYISMALRNWNDKRKRELINYLKSYWGEEKTEEFLDRVLESEEMNTLMHS